MKKDKVNNRHVFLLNDKIVLHKNEWHMLGKAKLKPIFD